MDVQGPPKLIFKQWLAMLPVLLTCVWGLFSPVQAATVSVESSAAENEPTMPRQLEEQPAPPARSTIPESPLAGVISELVRGNRDSMMNEIKHYSVKIAALRDSLAAAGEDVEVSEDQRLRFQESIKDMALVIDEITSELGRMEFQISDNMISLLDEAGEGIVINIPENLDEQVKAGIESITKIVLAQLPDSVKTDPHMDWSWFGGQPEDPPVHRQVSHGNVVKVWDDLLIEADEEVRGNVVVVVGDVRIEGRVDGNVTVVMGDLELADEAEINGQVVMVLGRVSQEGNSVVGDITVVDPLDSDHGLSLRALDENGWLVFLADQGIFLFVLAMVLVGMGVLPETRVLSLRSAVLNAPGPCLGIGFVVAMVGHLVALLLVAMLVLTVIGIPLALLLALAVGIIWIMATGVAALVLGEKIANMVGLQGRGQWLGIVLGMLSLHLISFLGAGIEMIPGIHGLGSSLILVGSLIKTLAYLFGLGALLHSRLGTASVPSNPQITV